MSTPSLSQFIRLGVNDNALKAHHPFDELNDKYRKQVIFASQIVEFAKGDKVFSDKIDRSRYYFLLKGKFSFKTGLLSKKTLASTDEAAQFDMGTLLPDGVDIIAAEAGHLLSVEADLLNTALVWMQAALLESEQPMQAPAAVSVVPMGGSEEEEEYEEDESDWMSSLLESPLFFNLPPANISKVFALFERVDVQKGESLIKQGDDGFYFYVLIHGKAHIVFDDQPERAPVAIHSGEYFGEDALVSGAPRSASVVMLTDGVVGRLDRDNFQTLLQEPVIKYIADEDVGKNLMKRGTTCVLVDVRSKEEFDHAPSPNSRNIPCRELRAVIPTLDKTSLYFISQEGGKRSELAAHLLSQANLQAFVIRQE
jgi:rhodanese-related sulfurtransferase